jgi:hypothetical protein
VVIEYPATANHAAYQARTDIRLTVPASGIGTCAWTTNTVAEVPQIRVVNLSQDSVARPVVHQEVDRWGNVLAANDPRMAWDSAQWRATFEYNAHNQLIQQTRPQDISSQRSQKPIALPALPISQPTTNCMSLRATMGSRICGWMASQVRCASGVSVPS